MAENKKPASAETKATKAAPAKKPAVKSTNPVAEKNIGEASAAPKAPVNIKAAPKKSTASAKKAERTSGLRVTQVASAAGRGKAQAGTLQGLGLGKISRSRILADTPEIRGMVHSLKHLVKMEVVG